MKKNLRIIGFVVVFGFFLSGCGLIGNPDNTKTVTTNYDKDGNKTSDIVESTNSDIGSYNEAVSHMVAESDKSISEVSATLTEANDCKSYDGEARAWCSAATTISINFLIASHTAVIPQVVRDMKKPTSGYDVLNNMIDKNTIPLLGAMGVIGWITEALSGAGQTVNNVDTGGGAIEGAFNRQEVHFTGNPTLSDGSSVKIPFLSPESTVTNPAE